MNAKKTFRTIETHTLGQPTRNVVSGFKYIPGKNMQEKFQYMQNNEDWFRKLLMYEPRGSEIMSGTLITEPCTQGTDFGVLYFESSCWMPMCGHDTIGLTVALIESGLAEVREPITTIKLDTPAGVITVTAKVENGMVEEVSFINAPAFVMNKDIIIKTKNYGDILLDIAWGGNVYAIIPVKTFGLNISPQNCDKLVEIANSIIDDINNQVTVKHPTLPFVNKVTHIEFSSSDSSNTNIKNVVVALPKVIDRSPCGTGTSAKAAVLYNEGKLSIGDSFIHESVIGSKFKCEIIDKFTIGGVEAIVPKITGNACIIGFATWILDPKDPFPEGFLLE